jgi:hypothetical protein
VEAKTVDRTASAKAFVHKAILQNFSPPPRRFLIFRPIYLRHTVRRSRFPPAAPRQLHAAQLMLATEKCNPADGQRRWHFHGSLVDGEFRQVPARPSTETPKLTTTAKRTQRLNDRVGGLLSQPLGRTPNTNPVSGTVSYAILSRRVGSPARPCRHVVQLKIVPRSPGNVVVRTRRVPAHAEPTNQHTLPAIKSQSAAKHIYTADPYFPWSAPAWAVEAQKIISEAAE